MSNHDGSYMLNEVLSLLHEKHDFFNHLDQRNREMFIKKILKIGCQYDCNKGEILAGLGKELEFCYYCQKMAKDFEEDSDKCIKCSTK